MFNLFAEHVSLFINLTGCPNFVCQVHKTWTRAVWTWWNEIQDQEQTGLKDPGRSPVFSCIQCYSLVLIFSICPGNHGFSRIHWVWSRGSLFNMIKHSSRQTVLKQNMPVCGFWTIYWRDICPFNCLVCFYSSGLKA